MGCALVLVLVLVVALVLSFGICVRPPDPWVDVGFRLCVFGAEKMYSNDTRTTWWQGEWW